jgi:hypothetical protein
VLSLPDLLHSCSHAVHLGGVRYSRVNVLVMFTGSAVPRGLRP